MTCINIDLKIKSFPHGDGKSGEPYTICQAVISLEKLKAVLSIGDVCIVNIKKCLHSIVAVGDIIDIDNGSPELFIGHRFSLNEIILLIMKIWMVKTGTQSTL